MTSEKSPPALFSASHSTATSEPCPRCEAPLRIKHIGQNSFWGCSRYPECDYTKSLHEESGFEPQPLPDAFCPDCSSPLLLKKGRYGFFVGCSNFPTCHYIADLDDDEPAPLCNCPQCKRGQLVERTNKYGKTFYACDAFPKCKYALNEKPVVTACPECDWPILTEKNSADGMRLKCPQKSCSYRSKPL